MRRYVLLAVAAGYWLALLVAVVAVTAVGEATHLRHPLYTLFVAAGIVLASAVLRWPPRRELQRRPSSIPPVRPPRPRTAEPALLQLRQPALTEVTQILPGAVMAAAWDAAQASAEPGPAVTVAEPVGETGGLGLYLSGHAAGAHPESDDGQRPDVDHLRGFAEGAVDRAREDDED